MDKIQFYPTFFLKLQNVLPVVYWADLMLDSEL